MISKKEGTFSLTGGGRKKTGKWSYTPSTDNEGVVYADGKKVGTFTYAPIQRKPIFSTLLKWKEGLTTSRPMACIGVTNGEVMKNIQDPSSVGAYFILPSQLNGAEYPSEKDIVKDIEDYIYDNTGGPRGQLAVHPAVGQFVLDNAASDHNPTGICSVDAILKAVPDIKLINGYLALPKLPKCSDDAKAAAIYDELAKSLHSLRPLIMHDVDAVGLAPSKREWSTANHRVGLCYASAVPVESYLNFATNKVESKLHQKIAEAILVAQYYGCLRKVAERTNTGETTKVYMLPLGGGVFNNSWPSITQAMCQAAELLADSRPDLFNKLEMEALAWSGSPSERTTLQSELKKHSKFFDPAEGNQRFRCPKGDCIKIDTEQKTSMCDTCTCQ